MKFRKSTYPLFAVVAGAVLYSCASIGNPEGGPIDKTPPIFVRSHPMPNSTAFTGKKIELDFDEIVTLDDPTNKIVVSPAQKERPKITANGKKVTVELIDTLEENTTYTIDFSNAIQDNNENNPLENFAFAFSTGTVVDTLRVSGIVLDSRTLEPQQGVIVGLHSNLSDTAFRKLKMDRVSRTNDRGQFTIRNVSPGKYHLFALNDLDRDYKFGNPSEDIAFLDTLVVPSCETVEVPDTVCDIRQEVDTVRSVKKVKYYPNDMLLSMFNENYKAQYLSTNKRVDSTRIYLEFAAPSDTLPRLRIIGRQPEPIDWYTLERSQTNDTLTYWIKQPELVSSDSLKVELRSLRTDTLNNLVWGIDTLNFTFKRIPPKKKKKRDKEEEDTIPEIRFLDLRMISSSTQEVYAPVLLESAEPIARLDTAAFHLDIKQDTLWNELGDFRLAFRDASVSRRTLSLRQEWEPGATYRLRVDSLGITSIYGLFTAPFSAEFTVRKMEDYGNLIFNIPAVQDSACVELLNASDEVVMKVPVKNGQAELLNLLPAKYYARLFIDRNGNGEYDTGNYSLRIQPEDTYYYPVAINLKKNWDIEQTWNIYELPIDVQKPEAIKKNKPERKKWEIIEQKPDQENEDDESGFNEFGDPNDPNQRYFDRMNGNYSGSSYRNAF